MKNIFLLLLIMYAINSNAQSILRAINNTNKTVYFALTKYDFENRYWVCEGWYEVRSYQQFDLDLGDYNGRAYIHGKQSALLGLSENTWGEGYRFCINPTDRFIIRDADHVDCDNKRDFSERKIGNGINRWEFNPK